MTHAMLKQAVRSILEKAHAYEWSLQGFGMLRLHMHNGMRLNVWNSNYRVPNVSLIHTHPWNFTSVVVAGELLNRRYDITPEIPGLAYMEATIKPGQGGGIMGPSIAVTLVPHPIEFYGEGETYRQYAEEIHDSRPHDGTVTLNYRVRIGLDEAQVYWPAGEQWVSAEPRRATPEEVEDIVVASLGKWFTE